MWKDWDFSHDGRIRQSERMRDLANNTIEDFAIIDLVAPLPKMREIINPDYTVWVDTIQTSRFPDTDKIFIFPDTVNIHVNTKNATYWAKIIFNTII